MAGFRQDATNLDDWVEDGNVEFAHRVYGIFRERVSNRVEYVDHLLTNHFDLAASETYQWKRKSAPWAAAARPLATYTEMSTTGTAMLIRRAASALPPVA